MATDLLRLLARGQPVLMDGAMGTELERRGLQIEEQGWSATALQDHSSIVQSVHEDYLRAGSRIHIVNSFALARHVLDPIGLDDRFEQLNQQSVRLFDRAVSTTNIDRNLVWAAGSISTFSAGSDRNQLPERKQFAKNCFDQAEILAQAGVDLFALEMLFDVEFSSTMLDAVIPFGLPVILGFTCEWKTEQGKDLIVTRGLDGSTRSLEEVLSTMLNKLSYPELIPAIMHSDIDTTHQALNILRQYFSGPVAAYPNSGEFNNLRMNFDTVCSPEQFAQAAMDWIQSDVSIIGGCCGIGPDHITELQSQL